MKDPITPNTLQFATLPNTGFLKLNWPTTRKRQS